MIDEKVNFFGVMWKPPWSGSYSGLFALSFVDVSIPLKFPSRL